LHCGNECITVVTWDIYFTALAEEWVLGLDDKDYEAIMAAIELLEERGPALGRPAVDRIERSRHHHMKELRSFGGHLRALFCFDPARNAIVLVGGDKRDDWTGWYERNIPLADDLYDEYLRLRGMG
jgi:hypothetical protein